MMKSVDEEEEKKSEKLNMITLYLAANLFRISRKRNQNTWIQHATLFRILAKGVRWRIAGFHNTNRKYQRGIGEVYLKVCSSECCSLLIIRPPSRKTEPSTGTIFPNQKCKLFTLFIIIKATHPLLVCRAELLLAIKRAAVKRQLRAINFCYIKPARGRRGK